MNTMRRGFTMVELIFVIVVIGILSSVAIPMFASSKDDAVAATCVHEFNQFNKEVQAAYIHSDGLEDFLSKRISDISNITLAAEANLKNGTPGGNGTRVHRWIRYICNGEQVGWIDPRINRNDNQVFEILMETQMKSNLRSPSSKKFYDIMAKQIGGASNGYYKVKITKL